ncbi:MAG: DUF5317 domain-containing protein [Peptoniphilus sp.]|nr:DUF5317 domain-containing protein [Peptoniphilus sp.]MDD7362929.1 DUF5317 domain-containing protein [Bacillota bacterium]MDY6044169.1 DUF5317 domain-containing protein [Peptoniphilus sp.]
MPQFKNLAISLVGAAIFIIALKTAPSHAQIAEHFSAVHGVALSVIAIGLIVGRHPGYRLAGIGCAMNALVVLLNGAMPVELSSLMKIGDGRAIALISEGRTLTHTIAGTDTRLRWLCDRIAFSSPVTTPRVMSAGDVFIAAGLFIFTASAVSFIFRRSDHYDMD